MHYKQIIPLLLIATTLIGRQMISTQQAIPTQQKNLLFLHQVAAPTKIHSINPLDEYTQNNENVIVVFYEDWCGPCKRMTPIFEELAEEIDGILFIKVKRELYRNLFDRYNLTTVPAILFFHNGVLVKIQPSSMTKAKLIKLIKKIYRK